MSRCLLTCALLVSLAARPPSAAAQAMPAAPLPAQPLAAEATVPEAHGFGYRGQWFFGGSSAFGSLFTHGSLGDSSFNTFALSLAPHAGLFFDDLAFVSLRLNVGYGHTAATDAVQVALRPAIGVRQSLGSRLHFTPAVGVGVGYLRIGGVSAAASAARLALNVDADVGFVAELGAGLGLTFGPAVAIDVLALDRNNHDLTKLTQVSLNVGLVGWL